MRFEVPHRSLDILVLRCLIIVTVHEARMLFRKDGRL